jgi:hypothetical protein
MEHNSSSANQEIPRLLWNPTAHYRFHNGPQPYPILSQMIPVHNFTPNFHIIFPSVLILLTSQVRTAAMLVFLITVKNC